MRPQTLIVALFAIVFGGSAAVGVRQYLQRPVTKGDMVEVVVAALEIQRGTLVTADLVTTRDYPKDLVPAGAILKAEDALDRSAFTTLVKDEPLLEVKLSPKGQRGMAAQIPKGMRAFTISTPNVASGVAGFVLPGNKVDVLLTVNSAGNANNDPYGGGTTTTLLQNVEILAVDQRIEAPAENKVDTKEMRSVTLLVMPDQAAKLDLGQNKGTLHLTLRNPEDDDAAQTRPATLADLRLMQERPGRPWGDQVKDVLKVLGAALAQAKPRPAPALVPRSSDMATQVPKGMRAFTIKSPKVASGVAGSVRRGNKVDVLLTVTPGDAADASASGPTTTLLHNVEVLAVGQETGKSAEDGPDGREPPSVTLLVTPDHADELARFDHLAQGKGTLHLALRNPEDDQVDEARRVAADKYIRTLRGGAEARIVVIGAASAPAHGG